MSTLRRTLATAYMLCLFTLLGSSSGAQVADADWLTYNRTLPGDRFSPLKEINRSNVAQLKAICTYTLPEVFSLQTGPLVVDGTMYFTTDEGSYAIGRARDTSKRVRRTTGVSNIEQLPRAVIPTSARARCILPWRQWRAALLQ